MAIAELKSRIRDVLAVGSLFEGKYRIRSPLGTGSFAYVMRAEHEVMGREVALKVLKPELVVSNPEVSERFLTEVRIVSRLTHPNTVTVYDFGETEDGIYYMVFEYVRGVSLDEVLAQGPLAPRRVVHIAKQILKSLDEAHSLGIIHRDLKPSNVMLTQVHGERDYVKVLDFGVAKLVDDREASGPMVRRSTQFIGTPIYMSPEQVLGQEVLPASDLYSLGLMLYEMMTGEPPLRGENIAAVAQQHIDEAPLPFRSLEMLPEPFQNLVLHATARYPQQRFESVAQFARALPVVGGVDHSAEFVGIMASAAETQVAPAKKDPSEPALDVFSGKNYIELPEESESEEAPPPPKLEVRPPVRNERIEKPRARPELRLDTSRVRRAEWERRRERARPADPLSRRATDGQLESRERLRRILIYSAGCVAAYANFVMVGAVLEGVYGLARIGAGLAPLAAAYLWAQFSSVRSVGKDFGRNWLIPIAFNLIYIFFIAIFVLALASPEHAAYSMREEATWFFGEDPQGVLRVLAEPTRVFGRALSQFFSVVSRLAPW